MFCSHHYSIGIIFDIKDFISMCLHIVLNIPRSFVIDFKMLIIIQGYCLFRSDFFCVYQVFWFKNSQAL